MLWLELKEVGNFKIHSNNDSGVAEWGVTRPHAKIWITLEALKGFD